MKGKRIAYFEKAAEDSNGVFHRNYSRIRRTDRINTWQEREIVWENLH